MTLFVTGVLLLLVKWLIIVLKRCLRKKKPPLVFSTLLLVKFIYILIEYWLKLSYCVANTQILLTLPEILRIS